MNKENLEIRNNGIVEKREFSDGDRHIEGYAIIFESDSEDMGFIERISRGAVSQELVDSCDVFALMNHDDERVLARSNKGQGSLKLTVDERGLKYEFDAADTQLGNDLLEYIKRGEIDKSSFCFCVDRSDPDAQKIEKRDGKYYRTINKISYIHDVSPVWNPAYSATSVSKRFLQDLEEFKEEEKRMLEEEEEKRKEEAFKPIEEKLNNMLNEFE